MSSTPERIEEEALSSFDSSTYYPAKIGEVIGNEYTVKVKLGFGRDSTTWLCSDQRYTSFASASGDSTDGVFPRKQFKVLKVLTARDGDSREAKVFKHLRIQSHGSRKPGRYCVRRPEDIFTISASSTQHHQCFVFEPLGPTLSEFIRRRHLQSLELEEVKWLTTYFLHALDFLHEHNVVHSGTLTVQVLLGCILTSRVDLKLDNIQLILPYDEEKFLASFVAAETNDSSFVKHTSDEMPIYKSREMILEQILPTPPVLCDLGAAKIGNPPHNELVQALPYRAPEVFLGAGWDSKIDIWTIGALVGGSPCVQESN